MDYQILNDELTNDPLTRGYAAMSDAEAAGDLNTVYRNRNRTGISGDQAFQATNATEFAGLTDVQKQLWLAFCGREGINPFGTANVSFVQSLFGGGSTTITNLSALRVETVSRGVELGLGVVTTGDVIKARAYPAGA